VSCACSPRGGRWGVNVNSPRVLRRVARTAAVLAATGVPRIWLRSAHSHPHPPRTHSCQCHLSSHAPTPPIGSTGSAHVVTKPVTHVTLHRHMAPPCLLPVLCVDLPPLIRTLPASTARATAMPAVCFQFDETSVSSVPSCPCSLLMGVWKPTGVVEDAQCGSGRAGGISFACSPAVNLVNLVRRIAPHARACTVRMARGPLPILSRRTLRAGAVVAARRGTVRGCGRPRLGYSR
jgi:hypothetical protein